MNKRSSMVLRVLINRYSPKTSDALLRFLPPKEVQEIKNQEIYSTNLVPLLQPQKSLSRIHYSWIQPVLESFPPSLQPTVTAVLAAEKIPGLKANLSIPVSNIAKTFIIHQIYQSLLISEHFPIEYLPETELTSLTKWTEPQLTNLIDFLGLYDLAAEVRHIVNRDHLKNIYACLTSKQFHYLKFCLHQKQQLTSPKLGIDPAKQDCQKLKKILYQRGLFRLGKALCGQHPDLIWHIAHLLDSKRGNVLLKEYRPDELPKVTKILKQQVLNLMSFLQGLS